ncbi:hypothetical protein DFJ63DRAFT_318168 [Scheffersomyces coipomensis]|uniref:uncharacterized protein n=1 Tax=Scheffersomyces coipomensis TaxID=1788519 RepID=UPI00315C84BD
MIRPVYIIERRPISVIKLFTRNAHFKSIHSKNPYRIYREENLNSETVPLLHRLRTSFEVFQQGKKFRISSKLISEFYKKENSIFLEDVVSFPNSSDKVFKFIMYAYKSSPSMRVLIIDDLVELIRQEKYDHIITSLKLLIELQLAPLNVIEEFEKAKSQENEELKTTLANCIALQALTVQERVYSTSVVNELEKNGIIFPISTIQRILQSLTVGSGAAGFYNSYAIIKTLQRYQISNFEEDCIFEVLQYLLQQKSILFVNKCFELIIEDHLLSKLFQSDSNAYIDIMMQVVNQNLDYGFYEVAFKYWKRITAEIEEPESKVAIIYAKLLRLSPDTAWLEKVIKSMHNKEVDSIEVTDVLIEKLGTNKSTHNGELLHTITSTLESPLRRSTLSSLFKSFLYQNNEQATDKVLQLIFKSKDGLESQDMDAMVKKLLKQGKVDQCIEMAKASSISVSKLAYVNIISHIFQYEEDISLRYKFLDEYSIEALKLPKRDHSFTLLTSEIIKLYSSRISNRAAKKMYLTIHNFASKPIINEEDKYYYVFNFKKFGIPNSFKDLITMNQECRIKCLDIIINKALIEKDIDTILWGIDEMRFIGLDVKDIIPHIRLCDKDKFIDSILKPEIHQQL